MVVASAPAEQVVLQPNPGPQESFLACPADVAIYGGAAGGGKTWALLADFLHYVDVPGFNGVIFRRTYPEITNPGSLWDASQLLYPSMRARSRVGDLTWTFPTPGVVIKFSHMQREADRFKWMSAEVAYIAFDQLELFTRAQFFYMLSRNRSTCGVQPYIRASCNPDPDSWIRELIAWWLDDEGDPVPERSGIVRWFTRVGDDIVWGESKEEVQREHPDSEPLSFTFIAAKLEDNPVLCEADPKYRANLLALPNWERAALLGGNWNTRPTAGSVFNRSWFEVVDAAPVGGEVVRYWDRAATKPNPKNPDPDWTAGVLVRKYFGVYYVLDVERFRETSLGVRRRIKNTAEQDDTEHGQVPQVFEQDPAQAGKTEVDDLIRHLAGHVASSQLPKGDKVTRAGPASAQAEAGNVKIVRGAWNKAFLEELQGFPEAAHDDQVDGFSGAFNHLNDAPTPSVQVY
jgi:predicted phage terminase large subunit-like protein